MRFTDPETDYAILQFDPSDIKQMKLTALKPRPDSPKVGLSIAVVGYAKGEECTISPGTIRRIDRPPDDDEDDSNVYFIQTSTLHGHGGSGSAIVTPKGELVGMHCSSLPKSSVSFGLTLDCVARSLRCLQEGREIIRGTILTAWSLKTFHECKQQGLTESWESTLRQSSPDNKYLLVAQKVIPDGPAWGQIQNGDILLECNGAPLRSVLEWVLVQDESVRKYLRLRLHRAGEEVLVKVKVESFQNISPRRLVTVSGAVIHGLTYRQARQFSLPFKGCFLSEAGNVFEHQGVPSGVLLDKIDENPLSSVESFIQYMINVPDMARVKLEYRSTERLHTPRIAYVQVDLHWHPELQVYFWNNGWSLENAYGPLEKEPARVSSISHIPDYGFTDSVARNALASMTKILCYSPFLVDGQMENSRRGLGLIFDPSRGLVLVSRAIVPHHFCDITLVVADSVEIHARVHHLHPCQGVAVVQYDPSLVDGPIRGAEICTSSIEQGSSLMFIGWNRDGTVVAAKTVVTDCSPFDIDPIERPQYRPTFQSAVTVDSPIAPSCESGFFVDAEGQFQAMWVCWDARSDEYDAKFTYAVPMERLGHVVYIGQGTKIPDTTLLNIDVQSKSFASCRQMGLTGRRWDQISQKKRSRHELFLVTKAMIDLTAHNNNVFREGDVVIELNGRLVTDVKDFDVMYRKPYLDTIVLRNGEEVNMRVKTVPASQFETSQVVDLFGATLQQPYHAVIHRVSRLPSHIYVVSVKDGSRAHYCDIYPRTFITEVNNKPVKTLDDVLRALEQAKGDGSYLLRLEDLNQTGSYLRHVPRARAENWGKESATEFRVESGGLTVVDHPF